MGRGSARSRAHGRCGSSPGSSSRTRTRDFALLGGSGRARRTADLLHDRDVAARQRTDGRRRRSRPELRRILQCERRQRSPVRKQRRREIRRRWPIRPGTGARHVVDGARGAVVFALRQHRRRDSASDRDAGISRLRVGDVSRLTGAARRRSPCTSVHERRERHLRRRRHRGVGRSPHGRGPCRRVGLIPTLDRVQRVVDREMQDRQHARFGERIRLAGRQRVGRDEVPTDYFLCLRLRRRDPHRENDDCGRRHCGGDGVSPVRHAVPRFLLQARRAASRGPHVCEVSDSCAALPKSGLRPQVIEEVQTWRSR